jgi:acyl-CoA thioester hydrolase
VELGAPRGLTIPIRWRDIDALGHVNNAVYLTYLEEILAGVVGPVLGDDWATARVELDFRSELRLADREVMATASVERVDTSSVTFCVTIARADGAPALEGRVVLVAWDRDKRRGRPLSDVERQSLGKPV